MIWQTDSCLGFSYLRQKPEKSSSLITRKADHLFVCSAEMLSMLHGYTGLLNEEQILLDVKTALDEFKKQNPKAKRDEIKFEEMCLVHEGRKM